MRNKLLLLIIASFLVTACANNKSEDPLIVPPNFNDVPDPNNPEKSDPKSSDQDLQELRDLLLN